MTDCEGEPSVLFVEWLAGRYQSVMKYNYSSGVQDGKSSRDSRYQNYTRKLVQAKTPLSLSPRLQAAVDY